MKSIKLFLFTGCIAISLYGCKKDSGSTDTAKGCNDPEAVNYNSKATVATDCIYPGDKLQGTWNVSEYESETDTTISYTATVTKIDNKTIHIKSNSNYPSPPPVYHPDNMTMQINWSTKTFVPNGNLTGSITDINSKWNISYTDSVSGTVYKVKQTFTH